MESSEWIGGVKPDATAPGCLGVRGLGRAKRAHTEEAGEGQEHQEGEVLRVCVRAREEGVGGTHRADIATRAVLPGTATRARGPHRAGGALRSCSPKETGQAVVRLNG